MQLQELVKNITFKGKLDEREVSAITYDSRKVKPGSLFVAISGMQDDGHNYIPQAIKNGAVAVLSNGRSPTTRTIPILQVEDPRVAMSHISAKFYGNPSEHMKIIGITGTNGKTSITYILHHILQKIGVRCGAMGTLGFRTPTGIVSTGFTTPESVELQQMLSTLKMADIHHVVIEISSHALDQHRVDDVDVKIAVYSNLTQEHLDFHGNMEAYFQSKLKLFNNLSDHNIAVINLDDSYSERIIANTSAKVITYGMSENADLYPSDVECNFEGIRAQLRFGNKMIALDTNLIGDYNLYNIMAAVAVSLSMDIQADMIEKAMKCSMAIPGRLERIPCASPGIVFIDYAHTPDAYEKLFITLHNFCGNNMNLFTVFGCGGNRDTKKRAKMAILSEKYSIFTTITMDNPRTESLENINADIVSGFTSNNYEVILDRKDAIYSALNKMDEKSILLVLGKGVENYQEIGKEKISYSDAEVIRSYNSAG